MDLDKEASFKKMMSRTLYKAALLYPSYGGIDNLILGALGLAGGTTKAIVVPMNNKASARELIEIARLRRVTNMSNPVAQLCLILGKIFLTPLGLYGKGLKAKNTLSIRSWHPNSGVVAHPYETGSSVRKKARVRHMANKTLKKVVHKCSLRAIRSKGDLKAYFERKVKEGKNKMLLLNAIRNKILHRIFACIRDQRMYVPIRIAS
jgi:hypothetical protein